jgi:phosphoribosylglycinamide formyltransferase-1
VEEFRFGWWTTGRDQAAVNLFKVVTDAVEEGKIKGRLLYLFSSKEKGEGKYSDEIIELAGLRGIEVETLSALAFRPDLRQRDRAEWRRLYHQRVYEAIRPYMCNVVVLAGYMWILSAEICGKIDAVNLHPALPNGPAGTWQEVIWQLLEQRAERTGAMMHLVTPELDKGPAITFFSFPIRGRYWEPMWQEFEKLIAIKGFERVKKDPGERLPLFRQIRHQGQIRELPLLVQTLRALSERKIILKDRCLFDAQMRPVSSPLDLSRQVEEELG